MREFFKDIYRITKVIYQMAKGSVLVCFLKSILQASIPFINIVYSAKILDGLLLDGNKSNVLHDLYWMVGVNLVIGMIVTILNRQFIVYTETINLQIRQYVALKALQLDYEQMETKETMALLHKASEGANANGGMGDFLERIGNGVSQIASLVYSMVILSGLFRRAVEIADNRIYQFFNSYQALFLFMLIFVVSIGLNVYYMKRIQNESLAFFELSVETNRQFGYYGSIVATYSIHKDIRIYKMKDLIAEHIDKFMIRGVEFLEKYSQVQRVNLAMIAFINQITVFFAYGFVGIKAILGIISLGGVLKYVNAFGSVNKSITSLIQTYSGLELQRTYLKNYFDFLNLDSKKYYGELPIEKRDDHEYEIEFKNVSFHYPNSQELILKNVSLKMDIGKKMAIVGPNGAGKTTFIKLLCRLYDPSEGEILLNGIDIKKYDYQEYLDLFSVVFQDFKLFSLGVAENVATSKEYDENLVWDVLKKTGVKERVGKMENGLNSMIYQTEEDGVEISGGEAQKIAISRALYKDASIVILDEPTSALDPISEYEIYANFNDLVKDKTSIYISHRMSSCRFCDVITVFNHGSIVQSGSHEELISSKDGLYYQLWNAQAKNYN